MLATDIRSINLVDPLHFRDGPPHKLFDVLREHDPVHWNEIPGEDAFWALTTYEDVVWVSRNQSSFTSTRGVLLPRLSPEMAALFGGLITFLDPPESTRLRQLVNKGFTPRMVKRLEERIRHFSASIVAEMRDRKVFDFVPMVAAELPAQVIADIIGVPNPDRHLIVKWASAMFGREDPESGQNDLLQALGELTGYVRELREERLRHPADDIFTNLIHAEVEGVKLTEAEFNMFFVVLAEAGFETTHSLLAQTMRLFLEEPVIGALARADLSKLPETVEELLRFISPVNFFARTAIADVDLRGTTIREGDYVVIWYSAANRDPAVFVDPHRFDIDRSPNQHVAFGGGGPHYCLGAHLARLETRLFLEELFKQGVALELDGPPVRFGSVFVNALKSLPVKAR